MTIKTCFAMILLILVWGSLAAVSKLLLVSLDSFQLLFFMFSIALAIMTIVFMIIGKFALIRRIPVKDFLMVSMTAIPSFLYFLLYFLALDWIPAIEASILNYLFPVFIIILSMLIDRERIRWFQAAAIAMGFLGVFAIMTNLDLNSMKLTNLKGDLLAAGAAFSWALFSVMGRKNHVNEEISNYIYTLTSFILSAVCLLIFSSFQWPVPAELAGVTWLALGDIVIGYYLWFWILKRSTVVMATGMAFITPFVTILFIVLLLDEKFMAAHFIGLLLVVSGMVMQNLPLLRKTKTES